MDDPLKIETQNTTLNLLNLSRCMGLIIVLLIVKNSIRIVLSLIIDFKYIKQEEHKIVLKQFQRNLYHELRN